MTLGFVLDTNVFVSALISRCGASHRLLKLIGSGLFDSHISVPLILEYEGAAKRRSGSEILLSEQEIDDIIDYICAEAEHHQIHFLWRPFLKDASDDMVLELAVGAGCEYIVTFNLDDFQGIEQFGIEAITPQKALELIGEL
jgi:putative PIN family toxin of toxin-antitoxin system